jgi:hypothetical protein
LSKGKICANTYSAALATHNTQNANSLRPHMKQKAIKSNNRKQYKCKNRGTQGSVSNNASTNSNYKILHGTKFFLGRNNALSY